MNRKELDVHLVLPTERLYRDLYPRRYQPEVMRWADEPLTPPTLTEFLAQRRDRLNDLACIERIICVSGAPVGTITAFGISRILRDCELGVVIVEPEWWGRGVGQHAMRHFFEILKAESLTKVSLETFEDNLRARAAFMRVGFERVRSCWDEAPGRRVVTMSCQLTDD